MARGPASLTFLNSLALPRRVLSCLNGGGAKVEDGVREEEDGDPDGGQHDPHPPDPEGFACTLFGYQHTCIDIFLWDVLV